MSQNQQKVRINLTPEQRAQLSSATGKQYQTLELTAEQLEERIAPSVVSVGQMRKAGGEPN